MVKAYSEEFRHDVFAVADYPPYEGMRVTRRPETVLVRGTVVVQVSEFVDLT